ncbi:MAG: hypothetical protein GOVbin4296_28 [Prokaryotic dsDNA virus sp.]|nr:MAG: hypothetical protein GOVbin4296_28 [Prokaryotic dsDNA virus sp.]|tara:strand:+ start:930 stop:1421 length:492 start_codon:yes stop_codon:yes gene_type:complete
MQRSLIAITRDILVAQNEIEVFNSEEAELRLQELFQERFTKENGMQYLHGEIEGELILFSKQLDKLKAYIKFLKKSQESLKSYVVNTYADTNQLPSHDVFNPIKVLESAGSVDIIDEELIPDEYYITVTTQKLDKKAILNKLKEGEEVPGCRLIKKSYVRGIK